MTSAPKVEEYRIPALFTVTAADDLTQRLKYRWVIRTGWASSQPYIAELKRDADAVLTMVAGASTLQSFKQYSEAGLKGRIPVIVGGPAWLARGGGVAAAQAERA